MKVILTVFLLLALALPCAAESLLDNLDLSAGWGYSFRAEKAVTLGKISAELGKLNIWTHEIPINADVVGVAAKAETARLGLGISGTLVGQSASISAGLAYVFEQYGMVFTLEARLLRF